LDDEIGQADDEEMMVGDGGWQADDDEEMK